MDYSTKIGVVGDETKYTSSRCFDKILREAEKEADVVLWDGGNNDLPFFKPDLHLVLTDPHRAGHELRYHPGEANLRRADVVVINKID